MTHYCEQCEAPIERLGSPIVWGQDVHTIWSCWKFSQKLRCPLCIMLNGFAYVTAAILGKRRRGKAYE